MIGAITPLVEVKDGAGRWTKAMLAYAAGSTLASILVGYLLGLIGHALGGPWRWNQEVVVVGLIGLASGEFWLGPRPKSIIQRQTQRMWRQQFGPIGAAFLWGFDLGLGLSTRVSFASLWALVGVCLLTADPMAGVVLMGGYGVGRSLLVATGLLLRRRLAETSIIPLFSGEHAWHRFHGLTLLVMAGLILLTSYMPQS